MSTPSNMVEAESLPPIHIRLREALAGKGTQKDIAAAIDVSVPTLQRMLAGTGELTVERLLQIAEKFEVDPVAIIGGAAAARSSQTSVALKEIDLAYGMGGTFIDDLAISTIYRELPTDWVRQFTRAPAESLFVCRGIGDSMFPTLLDSDLLLVDRSQQSLKQSDRIWVLMVGEVGMVKRLRVEADGRLSILSDNQSVPVMIAVDDEATLIGRVVAVIRKM